MQASSFPATAATSLIHGYCDDFIALAASMAQTLEQATMRSLPLDSCRDDLARVERGMRNLAEAIGGMLAQLPGSHEPGHAAPAAPPANAPAPAAAAPAARAPRPATAGAPNAASAPHAPAAPHAPHAPAAPAAAAAAAPAPRAARPAADATPPAHAQPAARGAGEPKKAAAAAAAATPGAATPQRGPVSSMLAGSNDTMPLRSVFQFLSRMRKSGTLRVTIDGEELTFDLGDGSLIATSSNRPHAGERLGEILAELRFLVPADIDGFVRQHGHSLRKLGGALVQAGRLTEGQLLEALELQVTRRFRRATSAQKATYDFRECPRPRGDGRIRIRAFEILGSGGDEPAQ